MTRQLSDASMPKTPFPVSKGFSPYQLVIGTISKLTTKTNNQAPTVTATHSSKIISSNLQTPCKVREAFTARKNFKKIKLALAHIIRTSGDIKYTIGDHVYYKRVDSREWHSQRLYQADIGNKCSSKTCVKMTKPTMKIVTNKKQYCILPRTTGSQRTIDNIRQ